MNAAGDLFVGLMSGTSLDAVDAVAVRLAPGQITLEATHSEPLAPALRDLIAALNRPGGEDELERMAVLDRQLGELFAHTVNRMLSVSGIAADEVRAIGSHGQTLRHRPPGQSRSTPPYSLQIGDPATIAELTGITTVADFRRRDIAAGGQGAPLVPAFHRALFSDPSQPRAIINIGGMANISLLGTPDTLTGFDTGPGNVLMDAWCQLQRGRPYDSDGSWAASGTVDLTLLNRLQSHPFFALPPPKSTGREAFNLHWVESALSRLSRPPDFADVQATLLELTAQSIASAVIAAKPVQAVYCCGGGAYNRQLMQRLATLLEPRHVATTSELGLAPEWVEAAAFAWLASQTLAGLPGNAAAVTGARGPRVLGAIHPA